MFFRIFVIALSVTFVSLCFVSCEKKSGETEGITVRFVTGFDDIVISDVYIDNGTDAYMPEDPVEIGYTFGGWYYDADCTRVFSTSDGLSEDTVLYAKWTEKHASTDGGSGETKVTDEAGFTYTYTADKTYTVVSYTGDAVSVAIGASYNGVTITDVSDNAFGSNSTLVGVTLPSTVKNISGAAFGGCSALKNITVSSDNKYFAAKDGVLYNKAFTKIISVGRGLTEDTFAVSEKIDAIGEYAFDGCVFTAVIPTDGKLGIIGNYSFAGFDGKVELTSNIAEIDKYAFYGASGEVTFAADCGVIKLTNGAFDGYKGKNLVIGGCVKTVEDCAFNNSVAALDFSQTGLTSFGDRAFFGYKGENLIIPFSVAKFGDSCFYKCVSSVTFDSNSAFSAVTENSFNQFGGKVTFPATVDKIEKNAFYAAYSAAVINFVNPESAINIAEGAFNMSKAAVNYGVEY